MNIVITGAAGFIGTNFVYHMLSAHPNYTLIGYDALTYAANPENLKDAESTGRFHLVIGDIRDREKVYSLFEETSPDIIVNFAAESHVDRSIENPSLFLETNIQGTSVLMDAALKYGVRRFHQVSTDEVYGDLPLDSPELKFSETSPLRPSSPYSASKASADLLVLSYHRTYNLPVTISRCSNNFGPFQHPEKLIPKTIINALSNNSIPVYGKGENIRDWIYVEDHCKAIDMIIHNGKNGEIYNIGADNEISNISLIKTILKSLGKSEELITHTADRKGHDLRYAIDNTKFQKELGPIEFCDFEEKLNDTIEWYVEIMKHE